MTEASGVARDALVLNDDAIDSGTSWGSHGDSAGFSLTARFLRKTYLLRVWSARPDRTCTISLEGCS